MLGLAATALGAWELIVVRSASVLFFSDLAYLALAICLGALGLGGLWSRRLSERAVVPAVVLVPGAALAAWPLLTASNYAWATGLFALPFVCFGAASAIAYRAMRSPRERAGLYGVEIAGAALGLLLIGPAALPAFEVPALGDVGIRTHLRALVAEHGMRVHRHATSPYARTDLVITEHADTAHIFTDAMFVTRSVRWDGRSARFDDPKTNALAALKRLPYALAATGDALLLGAGAGMDVAVALQERVGAITAVEVNPQTIAWARELDAWAGGPLSNPRVTVHVAEARRFVRTTTASFDHINLTLLQTAPAVGRGHSHVDARVLTVQAVREYLTRLRPNGILSVVQNTPAFAERTLATFAAALGERATQQRVSWVRLPVKSPKTNPFSQLLLLRNEPWTAAEHQDIATKAREIGAQAVAVDKLPAVRAATDDRPMFFLAPSRLSSDAAALYTMPLHVTLGGMLAVVLLVWLLVGARRTRGAIARGIAIACAGAGGMAVQAIAIYRLQVAVGSPGLAASVGLAAVLGGSGVGALFGGMLGPRTWMPQTGRFSGLLAACGAGTLALCGPWLADHAASWPVGTAAAAVAGLIAICSLPLALPFLRALDGEGPAAEPAFVIACDSIGGVVGALAATAVVLVAGFTALNLFAAVAFVAFALMVPRV